LPSENQHEAWLLFARKALDVPIGYSKEELLAFRRIALREHPSLIRIIEDYLRLAEKSETNIRLNKARSEKQRVRAAKVHLFDLLREKKFFPQNLDLAHFAARVLPHMRAFRFDKMSRSDIAARIIEYIENSDPRSRAKLEDSMRDALRAMKQRPTRDVDRRSFLSKWERIIKGLEL
jgi:hypothetical protein